MPGAGMQMTKHTTSHGPFGPRDRLLAIMPMLEHREHRQRGEKLPTTLRAVVEGIAARHGVSISTVWRWYRLFLRDGFSGLAHKRRDAGQSRFAKKHPEIVGMIQARLSRGRSALSVFKSLRAVLGPQAPSYPTVLQLTRQLHKAARHSGMREAA